MAQVKRVLNVGGHDKRIALPPQYAGFEQILLDVLWGWSAQIARSGQEFFAHKTGFTERSLVASIQRCGFAKTYSMAGNLEVNVLAFKRMPDAAARSLFSLPDG